MENTYEVAWIGAWNDINWGIKTQEDINFSYVTGTGIPYVRMLCVQNSKDGELIENSYSTDYFYYKPDGSWGIPMSGLYYTLKATATGAFKVKVALDKGVHDTYVVNTSTMKAERVLASGYIDGVNDGEGNKKLLAYDEVEAMNEEMGEDYQYVIGNGEAFWGWLFFLTAFWGRFSPATLVMSTRSPMRARLLRWMSAAVLESSVKLAL